MMHWKHRGLLILESVALVFGLGRGSNAGLSQQPAPPVPMIVPCDGEALVPSLIPADYACVVADGTPVIVVEAGQRGDWAVFVAGCDGDLDFTDNARIWLTRDPAVTARTAVDVYCRGAEYTVPEAYR